MQRQAADDDDDADIKPFRRLSGSFNAPAVPAADAVTTTTADSDTFTVTQLALSSLESAIAPIKQALTSPTLRKAAISSGILAVIVALSLGSAIFAYLLFYYLYVPRVGFTREIWLQYGQGVTPFARVDLKRASLASDLAYDVILDIVAPASPRNIELGNFMVDLSLQSADGSTIMQSSRAASLNWTPPLVRFLKALLRLPAFLLFDFYSHSQNIRVPIITQKTLRTFSSPRIASALVQVGRPGTDGIGPGELQIYSAKLRFVAHLTGLRWLMYYHRIISFSLFCGVFFTIALLTALVLWGVAGFVYAKDTDAASESAMPETESIKSEETLETDPKVVPLLRRKSSSMRAGREDPARRELEDQAMRLAQARNRGDAFMHGGTDTEDEHQHTLQHLDFGTGGTASEDEAVVVKREGEETREENSPKWQDVSFTAKPAVKKEEQENAALAGELPSLEGDEASTSARLARDQSLRRRASNRSLKRKEAP